MIENITEGREYYRETGILLEDGIKYLDITGNIYEDKIKNVLIVNKTDVQLAFFNLAICCSPLGGGCMVNEQKCVPLIC